MRCYGAHGVFILSEYCAEDNGNLSMHCAADKLVLSFKDLPIHATRRYIIFFIGETGSVLP